MCRSDRLLQHAGLRETDRHTLEGPNHHANRVDGRGWASGAYFGALAVVIVVGGICEMFLPYFHVLKGFQSNWSVANRDPGAKGTGFLQLFLQLQGSLQPAILCQTGSVPLAKQTKRVVWMTYWCFYVAYT